MRNRRHAALAGTAVAVLALAAAGCGGGDSYQGSGTSKPAGGSSPLTPGSGSGSGSGSDSGDSGDDYGDAPKAGAGSGSGTGVAAKTLAVRNVSGIGPVVTDSKGGVLYRFDKDTAEPPKSACDGDCAKAWPAVPADDATASTGIASDRLGRVVRADGTAQLTLGGWPVYRYAKDSEPGVAKGQGMGGTWHALAPDGKKAGAKPAEKTSSAAGVGLSDNPALGRIFTDGEGRTLYRFNKDSAWPMRFACTGACLDTWKPAKPADKKKLGDAIPAKLISTVPRPDGTKQLAVDCWPVYWFTGDKKAGDVNGQGKMGLWFAVSDSGRKITKAAAKAKAEPATGY
ncbi:SCO0930 family lipoprotein [Streptomyces sp. NPDC057654]|uniref:SCO0930 family lipoprotein n=1 Tax=Streptomyces sp. NPDC057654 TaxID=3346196 RepID=UPI0036756F20